MAGCAEAASLSARRLPGNAAAVECAVRIAVHAVPEQIAGRNRSGAGCVAIAGTHPPDGAGGTAVAARYRFTSGEAQMHDILRDRILRHLETLPELQQYQVLDYIEFLSSKYNREVRQPGGVQRFGELLEDKMRAQGVALGTIRGALGVVGTAGRVVSGITEAGRTVLREVESVVLPREPANGAGALPPPPLRQPDGDPRSGPPTTT